jgi:competence ComEA-like helix-hairpin-helix protein
MKHLSILLCVLLLQLWPDYGSAYTRPLDINSATKKELTQVPLIGKGIAQAIVSYRKEHGGFSNLDQLLEVKDIGPKTLKVIKPYFTIGKHDNSSHSANVRQENILLLPDALYYDALVDYIREADRSIDIAMFIFKTTKSRQNKPRKLVDELIKAQKRGVSVRIILEKSGYEESINEENEKVARRLRKNGITVLFDSIKKTTHTKLVIVDQRFSFVGSHNLTHSALAYNHELSLLIDDRTMAGQLIDYIDTLAH